MPYSARSSQKLNTCHDDLVALMLEVDRGYENTILEGQRTTERQQKLYAAGRTKIDGVLKKSKHQISPQNPKSIAVDTAPWPVDWADLKRFYFYIGYVNGIADQLYKTGVMKHKIRCGADWDGDRSFKDQTFHDLPHIELIIE
jgi:peptidoglycan L-alanyl-D-glutamate endopeptidase CwlK